ncbi:MAG TPA: hypothetical protein VFR85_21565 [Anaeromyxobacteraceae bacterium]|nr:hypothetical protein [Anaeromyxobacteraceae bacterium]
MKAPALLLVLLAAPAAAREVKVTLAEGVGGQATHFAFDTRSGASRRLSGLIGIEMRQMRSYQVRGRKLVGAGKALATADEVLYQTRVDGADVVVVRAEESSLSSPWRIFSACSGHPVQVSVVSVLVVEGGSVARSRELARSASSTRFTAAVLE